MTTTIFEAILTIITILITTFLVPFIKSRYTKEQIQIAENWIDFFVKSADMLFPGNGRGDEKKQYVMAVANQKLKELGIKIDASSVGNIIESKVFDIKKALDE